MALCKTLHTHHLFLKTTQGYLLRSGICLVCLSVSRVVRRGGNRIGGRRREGEGFRTRRRSKRRKKDKAETRSRYSFAASRSCGRCNVEKGKKGGHAPPAGSVCRNRPEAQALYGALRGYR
ncbi:hypothetical protein M441DRAFT_318112 [Trichoderma asperellum CBS 433.97]|uniref:Uncharacterized protein n=1 Tax=Trichoderma asperellum (strain ATCC 204424 / CBS 433.97 / NBRC 101777) TaxID=1042311 RepID=A0A2T3ZL14_TRIA4|nr:hypothetical protein M441DRAFT_318112 [Trichoderma asperellum CBS 433.97]PTB45472.1 hypothetical protein M441DRAFT_318112 [Trichoderma asperellum CBS 433.97]